MLILVEKKLLIPLMNELLIRASNQRNKLYKHKTPKTPTISKGCQQLDPLVKYEK
jgi:hypothetical protein